MDNQYLELARKQQISSFILYLLKVHMNFKVVENNCIFSYYEIIFVLIWILLKTFFLIYAT